jgi:hypothetical protein
MIKREKGPDQMLYEDLMGAFGFKHNRQAFHTLANRVPLHALRTLTAGDPLDIYALLAGVAGLLPPNIHRSWDAATRQFVRTLWDRWWSLRECWNGESMRRVDWNLSGLRPVNHPLRRMMAAALFFHGDTSLAAELLDIARKPDASLLRWLTSRLKTSPETSYWNHRMTLGGAIMSSATALIGRGWATSMIMNVLLPYIAAAGIDIHPLMKKLPPEEDNTIIRQTAAALFGLDVSPRLYAKPLRRQGLIQIHHDFCLNDRSRCARCELPAQLRQKQ